MITGAAIVDISAAYDTVNHRVLIQKLYNITQDSPLYRVIQNMLSSRIQNPFLTAQSTQIKSVISVPIKAFIHHYPRALFNDIPRVGAHFYDIPGSGRSLTTYPGHCPVGGSMWN